MTDEVTPASQQQNASKTQEKKSNVSNNSNRGGKRSSSQGKPGQPNGRGSPAGQRPSSRGSVKKGTSSVGDGVSDGGRKNNDPKKSEARKPQGSRSGGATPKRPQTANAIPNSKATPNAMQPPSSGDSSIALSSLQKVITDLKSISPPTNSAANNSSSHSPAPSIPSSLPANAPVFQPGAQAYPGPAAPDLMRHRKAASMGAHAPGNYNSFSPALGATMEDLEDLRGNSSFEEGEILDIPANASSGQTRPPLQNFTAPRFAALAQQEQGDSGASGRPQLAPGFMFGRRRASANPSNLGPPIGEEDMGFQFPQQSQTYADEPIGHARAGSGGEISGIMAEQIALQSQIEALQQQQQALLQQQLASNQLLGSTFTSQMSNRATAHRRVQSTLPMSLGNQFGTMGQFTAPTNLGLDLPQSLPRGHGRRHSVNVINKGNSPGASVSFPVSYDNYEDGFSNQTNMSNHSRQPSRADSTWRINGGVGAVQSGVNLADNLAQAQAQLQSLQQFRAAAGGHHQKLPSFSFPNMLPNMMAANMMGLGGYNLLQQQQQQFQLQLQQQSSQPQRKSLFAPYLPQASLPPLLAAGKLVVGILRVNKRNRSDAYVATEVLDADIYICGSKDRNRALEGDIVAVELLDVDEVWGTKKEKEEKKRKKEENAAYDPKTIAGRKNDKKKDDVEVEGQGLMLFEDEEVTDEIKPQFAGHVVAVVERMPGQLFSGTLGLLRPSSAATKEKQEAERREREGDRGEDRKSTLLERPKIVWFKPTDKRVPLIAIPTEQAPLDFIQNSEAYANKLFVACIKRHPISSLHPFGTLVEELGPIGDIEVETSALLKDCNFPTEEFGENVLKCLPPMPWTIPERELEIRKDLRRLRVFTIDPDSAKDLDDALSIQKNDDGSYDIGVHIADVSYFVKANSALDRDARKRATSVYLVQRSVPMLPPVLSEQLCSLVPGQDRLAFSVIFTLSEDGRLIKKWFGKTVINSSTQLSYSEAQAVIDGQPLGSVPVTPGHGAQAIEHDIKVLSMLSKNMREQRLKTGALDFESNRLAFVLDEQGLPIDCSPYQRSDANDMVEEFMLLANMSVAQQIAVNMPEQALLRRHENPIERRLNVFKQRAERLGYTIDTSSVSALMRSLQSVNDTAVRKLLELLLFKVMPTAKYFCAGMLDIAKYHHYALNTPLYTHFTSPIRRYADIIVHRQLEAATQSTGSETKFAMDRDSVAKIAQQCNIKKDSARLAQEQSAHLFLCMLISDLTHRYGPVIRQATVVAVLDAAFDVLVPEFGIEKRVHVDQMPIENHVFDEHTNTLQIYWSTRDVITWLAENSDDEHLKKVKQTAEQHALKMEVASRSVHDESALFDEDETDEIVIGRTIDEPTIETAETSKQRLLSQAKLKPEFEGLRTTSSGHKIQDIRELMTVPVIVTADLTKSPPVIKVYSVNPYAEKLKR